MLGQDYWGAQEAARLLVRVIPGEVGPELTAIVIDPELVVRGSVQRLRTEGGVSVPRPAAAGPNIEARLRAAPCASVAKDDSC